MEKFSKQAQKQRDKQNVYGTLSGVSSIVPLGQVGVGTVCLAGGAEGAASIPVLGHFLTTTTAAPAVTVTTFNPVGMAVGAGFALLFGLVAIKSSIDWFDAKDKGKKALESKAAAEKEVEEKRAVWKKAEETEKVAKSMAAQATFQKDMWNGVSQSAEKAARTFSTLKRIDPTGARRKKFSDKMEKYAEDLLYFVQACTYNYIIVKDVWLCKLIERFSSCRPSTTTCSSSTSRVSSLPLSASRMPWAKNDFSRFSRNSKKLWLLVSRSCPWKMGMWRSHRMVRSRSRTDAN